ncbi:MAG: fused MFS/spermidine synthase [Deltaproteobacteria bacterium]|nr:fused MFS/spermidine synthase [Deltaproteobacteria bacterium]
MFEDTKPEIIFEGDSEFSHITIVEQGGVRTMYLGPTAQEAETSISVADPEAPIFEYPGLMLLALALRPRSRKILMLGLGGGFIPRLCQRYLPEHQLTVVEIDPLVVDLAQVYFGFTPGGNVQVEIADGLDYLTRQPPRSFDQIWLDAFDGDYIPAHLTTKDFLRLSQRSLRAAGLLAQNLHQTRPQHYHRQLGLTAAVFQEPSLLVVGARCANTVVISPNGPPPLPRQPKELVRAVREFGSLIGPYDLEREIRKVTACPTTARPASPNSRP